METPGSRPLPRGILAVVACVLALTLTACGDEPDTATDDASTAASSGASSPTTGATSATSSPTRKGPDTSKWPDCEKVWIAGKRVPSRYRGCVDGATPVRAKLEWCESGQIIVTHAGRFYAVLGGPVNETAGLKRSAAYQKALDACFA